MGFHNRRPAADLLPTQRRCNARQSLPFVVALLALGFLDRSLNAQELKTHTEQTPSRLSAPVPDGAHVASSESPHASSHTASATSQSAASAEKDKARPGLLQPPPGFDTMTRSKEVLAHLSSVIRFYRLVVTPIQTVGEPSDLLYHEQAIAYSTSAAKLAFDSARAEATLIEGIAKLQGNVPAAGGESQTQRLQATRNAVVAQVAALKDQDAALTKAIAIARPKNRPALEAQQSRVEGALELQTEMADALGKVASMADPQAGSGLLGDVDRLQRSAPELAESHPKTVSPPLESLSSARSAGVSSQASTLFHLLSTRHSIEDSMAANKALEEQASILRAPLITVLRSTIQQGQALAQQSATTVAPLAAAPIPSPPGAPSSSSQNATTPATSALTDAEALAATRNRFDSLSATFKSLSAAAVPLSQEIVTLEQNQANLIAWRTAVNTEYTTVLRNLLLRVVAIAIALGVIFLIGEIWRRATTRYVHDIRRRRQLLVMRRIVVSFFSGIVVIFGMVSQFNSLATFAGFITAGLAVGLQTILLSVAAYFFIVGRYGVRVGDRITVAGVTGDVIDVGLVRFYILELAGSATDLHPTGRVAVFSNAVLFQAGTPLYKQMPGTEYAWHELTVKLALTADYRRAASTLLESVKTIYERYRPQIERQHGDLEAWMDAAVDAPRIESHLQLAEEGLQFWVRFPVEIRNAAEVDEEVTNSVLTLMAEEEHLKSAITAPPIIKGVVKG